MEGGGSFSSESARTHVTQPVLRCETLGVQSLRDPSRSVGDGPTLALRATSSSNPCFEVTSPAPAGPPSLRTPQRGIAQTPQGRARARSQQLQVVCSRWMCLFLPFGICAVKSTFESNKFSRILGNASDADESRRGISRLFGSRSSGRPRSAGVLVSPRTPGEERAERWAQTAAAQAQRCCETDGDSRLQDRQDAQRSANWMKADGRSFSQ